MGELSYESGPASIPPHEMRVALFADLAQTRLRWLVKVETSETPERAIVEGALEVLSEMQAGELKEYAPYVRMFSALSFSKYCQDKLHQGQAVDKGLRDRFDLAAGREFGELQGHIQDTLLDSGGPLPEPWLTVAEDLTLIKNGYTTLPM